MELDLEARQAHRWQQWRERCGEPPAGLGQQQMQQLAQVWEASDYLFQSCLREPALLSWLLEQVAEPAPC